MMERPLVSAIVPAFNHERFVGQALESIAAQTYSNIELIVINDGSTDGTHEVIVSMLEKLKSALARVVYVNRENQGLIKTLNEAVRLSRGKYYAVVASDDRWLPVKTERQVLVMEQRPDAAACSGQVIRIDQYDRVVYVPRRGKDQIIEYSFEDVFLRKYKFWAPAAMVRREYADYVGGYDERIGIEDWYLWLRLTEREWTIIEMPETLACYRVHSENLHRKIIWMNDESDKILKLYQSHPLYPEALAAGRLAHFNRLCLHEKREALKRIPEYLRYVGRGSFWRSLAKLAIPSGTR